MEANQVAFTSSEAGLFETPAFCKRRRVQRVFRDSLCRNGILALGPAESLGVVDWDWVGLCEVTDEPDLLRKGAVPPC